MTTMPLPLMTQIIWAAGFVLQVALLAVLIIHGRWRKHPLFTCYIAYDILQSVLLFASNSPHGIHIYRVGYWASVYVDHLFELLVVWEIAVFCFYRKGNLVTGTRRALITMIITAPLISWGLSLWILPPHTTGTGLAFYRGDLCASLIVCSSLAGVSWLITRLRIIMSPLHRAIWIGFMLSAGLSAVRNVVVAAIGSFDGESFIDYAVTTSTVCVLMFWLLKFLVRQPVSSGINTSIRVAVER